MESPRRRVYYHVRLLIGPGRWPILHRWLADVYGRLVHQNKTGTWVRFVLISIQPQESSSLFLLESGCESLRAWITARVALDRRMGRQDRSSKAISEGFQDPWGAMSLVK